MCQIHSRGEGIPIQRCVTMSVQKPAGKGLTFAGNLNPYLHVNTLNWRSPISHFKYLTSTINTRILCEILLLIRWSYENNLGFKGMYSNVTQGTNAWPYCIWWVMFTFEANALYSPSEYTRANVKSANWKHFLWCIINNG